MTYDAPADYGDPNHYLRDPSQCNPIHDCHPFEEVKDAAKAFVDQMYFPYDRVAVVTFDGFPNYARVDLDFSDKKADIVAAINGLNVVQPDICDTTEGPCRQYQRYADNDPVYGNNDGNPTNEPIIDANGDGIGDLYYGFDCPIYNSPDPLSAKAIPILAEPPALARVCILRETSLATRLPSGRSRSGWSSF